MSHGVKLTVAQQVEHMKSQGITFTVYSEEEAIEYLEKNNNYFKLRAYRKNYDKNGEGQYIGLDFAYLRDLAIIDMRLRYCLLEMCLDIEHAARVHVINAIVKEETEDGYTVVRDFKSLDEEKYKAITDRARKSPYCEELVTKYDDDMPVWAFVEILQFSDLCSFYKFVAQRLKNKQMDKLFYLFQEVRQLRNACAHSNCILNDLRSKNEVSHRPDQSMMNTLGKIGTISKATRQRKMSNDRVRQVLSLLYLYVIYVESKGLKAHHTVQLREVFFRRYNEHSDYYRTAESISTTFEFFCKVIDNWYPA